ncbi:hypothetical protein K474DRAFT_1585213 [Panus rudis PR-1116 ss-1]|nr:hypothetical protein K474DRAFT_1585213 [Panus rudis PR-1116 ss-1]
MCQENVSPLTTDPSYTANTSTPTASLTVLRKDFLSLLTLVYTSSTKVALSLRPSEPAYSASIDPITDLVKHTSSLATCATLFDPYGVTLAKHVRQSAKDVLEAVQSLSQTFSRITSDTSQVADGDDFLVRTGAVHDIIETIKRELPEDNVAAVKKKYVVDRDMMEDSLQEVSDLLEDAAADGEDEGFGSDDDDFGNDEWDELGFGSSKKLSEAEVERLKKIQPLLRLSVLLHKRIFLDLLKNIKATTAEENRRAETMLDVSNTLLIAHEDLVAGLHAPQKLLTVQSSLTALSDASQKVKDILLRENFLPEPRDPTTELEQKMAAASIKESNPSGGAGASQKKERDIRKWFDTAFDQVQKISRKLHDEIDTP